MSKPGKSGPVPGTLMTSHLAFLRTQIDRPVFDLYKDLDSKLQFAIFTPPVSHITGIQLEKIVVSGRLTEVRRLFVKSSDSGVYCNVGWVLPADAFHCMICCCEFKNSNKIHCHACGNVLCERCKSDEGICAILFSHLSY